jgi:hypothetical protein
MRTDFTIGVFLEWGMEHDENTMEVITEEDGMRGFSAVFYE